MKAPGDARVPRLAALLASLRCLRRRGSPSAPAPFSPTHCRPLCNRYHYRDRRETTRAFLTHGLDRLQLHNGTATGVSSCRADARFARSRRASAHACRAHGIPRRPIRAVGEPRGASPAQPHPRASSAEGGAGSGGSLRYAGPPPHPVLQSSSRRAPRSSPRGRGSDRPFRFRCVVHGPVRRLDLPAVGRRRCSVSSRRTGATRCRRLPHPALSALPERGFGRPVGVSHGAVAPARLL